MYIQVLYLSAARSVLPIKHVLIKRLILVCHNRRADRVAGDGDCGPGHIEDTVDTHDQADRLDRKADGVEYHRQGNETDARDTCRFDGDGVWNG